MVQYQDAMTPAKVPAKIPAKTDGYVVIIVLLLTAVLLMMGLSLATRTTEELNLAGQETDTTRVLNQAETGLEQGLSQLQAGTWNSAAPLTKNVIIDNNTRVAYTVTGQSISTFTLGVKQGEVITLPWYSGTEITWLHSASCTDGAALLATLYYQDGGSWKEAQAAYRPYGSAGTCAKGTNFMVAGSTSGGSKVTLSNAGFGGVTPPAGALLRLRPVYNDANLTITGPQVTQITSSATQTSSGDTAAKRTVTAIRTEMAAPAIFDYAVFSGGNLVK